MSIECVIFLLLATFGNCFRLDWMIRPQELWFAWFVYCVPRLDAMEFSARKARNSSVRRRRAPPSKAGVLVPNKVRTEVVVYTNLLTPSSRVCGSRPPLALRLSAQTPKRLGIVLGKGCHFLSPAAVEVGRQPRVDDHKRASAR